MRKRGAVWLGGRYPRFRAALGGALRRLPASGFEGARCFPGEGGLRGSPPWAEPAAGAHNPPEDARVEAAAAAAAGSRGVGPGATRAEVRAAGGASGREGAAGGQRPGETLGCGLRGQAGWAWLQPPVPC